MREKRHVAQFENLESGSAMAESGLELSQLVFHDA